MTTTTVHSPAPATATTAPASGSKPAVEDLTDDQLAEAHNLKDLSRMAAQGHYGARLMMGSRLLKMRKSWPRSGPRAGGWQRFLLEAGVDERSFQRYLRTVREHNRLEKKVRVELIEDAVHAMKLLTGDERERVLAQLQSQPATT